MARSNSPGARRCKRGGEPAAVQAVNRDTRRDTECYRGATVSLQKCYTFEGGKTLPDHCTLQAAFSRAVTPAVPRPSRSLSRLRCRRLRARSVTGARLLRAAMLWLAVEGRSRRTGPRALNLGRRSGIPGSRPKPM
jgi:hypothetical protein